MTAKAIPEPPICVTCADCHVPIANGPNAICLTCAVLEICVAENVSTFNSSDHPEALAKRIRSWANRRCIMGQISKEVRDALELCADDMEVGHG